MIRRLREQEVSQLAVIWQAPQIDSTVQADKLGSEHCASGVEVNQAVVAELSGERDLTFSQSDIQEVKVVAEFD